MAAKTDERLYVIPLTDAWKCAYKRRSKKSISAIRAFASRHMKHELKDIMIARELNEHVWSRGIKFPPRSVKVRAVVEKDKVWVGLQGEKMPFEIEAEKKAKEEKEKAKAKEESKKEALKAEAQEAKQEQPKKEAETKPEPAKAKPKPKSAEAKKE